MSTPELGRDTVVQPREGVVWQVLDGEAVLLDVEGGKYFGLNDTGTRIWELLSEGRSLGAIEDALLEEMEVERERLRGDLRQLVVALEEAGLVLLPEAG